MIPPIGSNLTKGNTALRQERYEEAVNSYAQALLQLPEMVNMILPNLQITAKKYREKRATQATLNVAVCGWDLAHNAAGRAYTLATIYQTFAKVEIIGCLFPQFGAEVWLPIRETQITKHTFLVEQECNFFKQALIFVSEHPYDVVHLSKPRAPNIFLGALYKLLWNARILIDVDDEELGFVGAETPLQLNDFIKKYGEKPTLNNLAGKDWTRVAVSMVKAFDGITVSNPALQQIYGGEIIHHARLIKNLEFTPENKATNRAKHNISSDKIVVLFFGTPRSHKGIIETAKAIESLKRSDIIYLIAGTFEDKNLKDEIKKIKHCNTLFIENHSIDSASEILSLGDICILAQNKESKSSKFQVPAKLSDALATRLVVIASNTPALAEFHQNNCFIDYSDDLSGTLRRILNNSVEQVAVTTAGYNFFKNNLSPAFNAKRLIEVINKSNTTPQDNIATWFLKVTGWKLIKGASLSTTSTPKSINGKSNTSIDIVIPVFNALDDVKKCLDSVYRYTDGFSVRTYIINDASNQETTEWLRWFSKNHSNFILTENEKNQGYTKTVNIGLRQCGGDYIVTLNSDTVVTNGWLISLIDCFMSDSSIGVAGPLSNAASWQNVPKLLDDNKQFAVNELPLGWTPDDMAELVQKVSEKIYPKVPFINGFCFMISRQAFEKVGLLDEIAFPTGYGEENDYCIRVADAGFSLSICDSAYVFHSKSKSFGHDQRKELSRAGSESLKSKHGKDRVLTLSNSIKDLNCIEEIRDRVEKEIRRRISAFNNNPLNYRILFLLPVSGGGGGVHSIVQETMGMRRLGVNAKIAVPEKHKYKFIQKYSDINNVEEIFLGFESEKLISISKQFDIIIGTIYTSMRLVKQIADSNPNIIPAYYIQDYEPLFSAENSNEWHEARKSYELIPDAVLFAKTDWIRETVYKEHGIHVKKVSPSIDHKIYKPVSNKNNNLANQLVIAAMIRPKTPRRGAGRTMKLLKEISSYFGEQISIHIFGTNSNDPLFQKLDRDFLFKNHGELTRIEVAQVLQQSDYFIDLSDYQAFGRTGLEAMACGVIPIITCHGGVYEYAKNLHNSLIVDPFSEELTDTIINFIESNSLNNFRINAIATAAEFSIHKAAVSELLALTS